MSDDSAPPPAGSDERTLELGSAADALRPRAAAAHRASLLVYDHEGVRVVALKVDAPVTIGRGAPADVVVRERTLSQTHARVMLDGDGQVWIEDLGSTNGTRVDGAVIEQRQRVDAGDEIALGNLAVAVHARTASAAAELGRKIGNHDRFVESLEDEVLRSRTFGRQVGLLMVRTDERVGQLGRWCARVQNMLRPFDRLALYGGEEIEITVPETSQAQLLALAERITAREADDAGDAAPALVCGVGLFPDSAASAAELVSVVRDALRRAHGGEPIKLAEAVGSGAADVALLDDDDEDDDDGPVVRSAAMREVYRSVDLVANATIPVLIHGETGTGKELVAREIHQRSERRHKPMRSINCGAIPGQLVESLLFGHERGAFTGADQRRHGLFEDANGGTVLLDEVGELSSEAQVALLRVLEGKTVTRVGSTREIAVDVRVVCATHRDLEAMCTDGSFRSDLYYRLNTMTIQVPPLRERVEEIESLALRFIRQANRANGCELEGIDRAALDVLQRYRWPGNVRELRNEIERCVVIARRGSITCDELSRRIVGSVESGTPRVVTSESPAVAPAPATAALPELAPTGATPIADAAPADPAPSASETATDDTPTPVIAGAPAFATAAANDLKSRVRHYEQLLLLLALERSGWNQAEAARVLSMPLRTLFYKVSSYELKRGSAAAAALAPQARALGATLEQELAARGPASEDGFKGAVQSYEAQLIRAALDEAGGNRARAARELAIAPRTLAKKVARYGLDAKDAENGDEAR